MAKKHIIDSGRWTNTKFRKLSAEEKITFEYLLSNPLSSKSGIYRIYSGAIMDGVGEHIMPDTNRVKSVMENLEKIGLIEYDAENHILYIKEFHKLYVPFGSTASAIVAQELVKEMTEYENPEFWNKYWEENRDRINDFFNEAIRNSKKPETIASNPSVIKLKTIFLKI